MYPTLYHAFYALIGLDLPFLKFLNSFGFFVALSFVFASWTLGMELRRKEKQGLLRPVTRTVMEGAPPTTGEVIVNGLIGFVLGWKGIYLLLNFSQATADPQGFLLSGRGSFIGGVIVAGIMIALKWQERRKLSRTEPRKKEVRMMPHEHAGNITITAAIWGIIGAKLFHWLENPDELAAFLRDPSPSNLFSGLTMYGGLLLAGAMVIRYFIRNGIPAFEGADAAAPGVMLAYGIGRIGCQVSGDGDWGIVNTTFLGPGPRWLWQYDYPNNVNNVGIPITDGRPCFEGYCHVLPETVFPTPIYETLVCVLFFGLLWAMRKRARPAGMIFFSFLILNGIERFLVEKIRVNVRVWGDITQAEIISVILILAGIAGIIWLRTKRTNTNGPVQADTTS
jgi:phosphatidylglycerol---prolipoprotein diacylglyceryl transferase